MALTAAADAAPAKPKKKKKKKASDLAAGIAASVAATMGAVKALAAQNSGATADEKTGDDATATAATSSSSSSSGAARGALGRGRGGLMMRGRGGFGRGGFGRGATVKVCYCVFQRVLELISTIPPQPSAVPLKAGKPVTNIKFSLKSAKVSQVQWNADRLLPWYVVPHSVAVWHSCRTYNAGSGRIQQAHQLQLPRLRQSHQQPAATPRCRRLEALEGAKVR